MKKYIKRKLNQILRERDVGAPSPAKKEKNKKNWILEYKWKSRTDYEKYPKWFLSDKTYTEEWTQDRMYRKFNSDLAVQDYLKSQLRSHYLVAYVKGRDWRARNIETQEIIEFPNIENYYII